jgi:tetratricopeptide (TPR) repeat protein
VSGGQLDPQAEGAALSNLAILTTIADRPAEARELFRDALAIHRAQGDRRGEAVVLGNLGDLYLQNKDWDIALLHLNSALITAREIGDRHIEGCFLGSLGEVQARTGHLPQARSQMARAEHLLREVGDTNELICRRGNVELLGQYPHRGRQCLEQAQALVSAMSLGPETKPHQTIEELRQTLQAAGITDDAT